MRRAAKILAWIIGILIAVPVVLVIAVLIIGNLPFGQRLLAPLVGRVTSGQVTVEGLSGRFPDDLRLAHVQLRDANGAWASFDTVRLTWSPLQLLHSVVHVTDLTARHGTLIRQPVSSSSSTTKSSTNSSSGFGVRIAVDHLQVDRLDIDKALALHPATVALHGNLDLVSSEQGNADIHIRRLDAGGTYTLYGVFDPSHIDAKLSLREPAGGLVSGIAGLPQLGALAVDASVSGPKSAEQLSLNATAGPLKADAKGTVDLTGKTADLDITANAPAMEPKPGLSWQSVALTAHVHGPFSKPDATGRLDIATVKAAGAEVRRVLVDLAGNAGNVVVRAQLDGVRIPGPKPDLLENAPLFASADIRLDQKNRPTTFSISHPLLTADGHADTAPSITGAVSVTVPDLAPLAGAAGIALQGHTVLETRFAVEGQKTSIDLTGILGVTGGMAPAPALLGDAARIALAADMQGQDITLSHLSVDGRTLRAALSGTDRNGTLDLNWDVALSDLRSAVASVAGALEAKGKIAGALNDLSVAADVSGRIGAHGVPPGPVHLTMNAKGLPEHPTGRIEADGTIDGAPLNLAATADRQADGTLSARIERADWKSAHAEGQFTLKPGAKLPLGRVDLRMTRLADLQRLVGQAVTGSITANAVLDPDQARLTLDARNAGIPGSSIARTQLNATVRNPMSSPTVNGELVVDGIAANGITGSARVQANGPQDALALRLSALLRNFSGSDASINSAATVNATAKQVTLSSLGVDWHGENIRLLAPARLNLANGLAVDRLRLGAGQATLDLAGRVSPTLDLTAAIRNVTADLVKPFAPTLAADGTVQADAKLSGTLAAPRGTIRMTATGLRMRTGPGSTLPPANLTATADLAGRTARIDTKFTAGNRVNLAVTGTAPLTTTGQLALRTNGAIDLTVLDPVLMANGRRVRGRITLDAAIAGTATAPRVQGNARWAGGEVQDFVQGVHVTDIAALIQADGDTLRIASFTGRAGPGTVGLTGTIGLTPPMPIDLHLVASNAKPLASDRLTATIDADLAVKGEASAQLAVAGRVHIRRADINIPEHMPASIAVLDVRRPGQKPPPPPAAGPNIALDITLDAPQQIFVRGRGLSAEMGGRMHVGGTTANPQPTGGFQMRYGNFSVAGTSLDFTRGEVQFNGASITDPLLDFEATSTSANVVATLKIGGYASAPKITLSSVPELPQDEVLAYLLFRRSTSQLSPFQIAAIAQALASFSGVNTGVGDPLASIRRGLGLDRLAVGTDTKGGATLEAGRYVANGVFVGAKQGVQDSGTQAEVQIDLTKRLKLETDVGSGPGGNSVGLTYQFQY